MDLRMRVIPSDLPLTKGEGEGQTLGSTFDILDEMILNPSRCEGQHGPKGESQTLRSTFDPEVWVRVRLRPLCLPLIYRMK